jgi:hypothetical protein
VPRAKDRGGLFDQRDKSVTVRFRINSQDPIKEIWRPLMDGLAAFAPKPEQFIRALPNSGRGFIRALTAAGANKDTNFYYLTYLKSERRLGAHAIGPARWMPIILPQKQQ